MSTTYALVAYVHVVTSVILDTLVRRVRAMNIIASNRGSEI